MRVLDILEVLRVGLGVVRGWDLGSIDGGGELRFAWPTKMIVVVFRSCDFHVGTTHFG